MVVGVASWDEGQPSLVSPAVSNNACDWTCEKTAMSALDVVAIEIDPWRTTWKAGRLCRRVVSMRGGPILASEVKVKRVFSVGLATIAPFVSGTVRPKRL